ncbi:MAG TPA: NADH-quinone oxidoreductase subunit H, partial [Thermoplasmatales archaeon]|nr:NADH-quinone oxidoreductase subunit H [Thermoplasmatales archaeon]
LFLGGGVILHGGGVVAGIVNFITWMLLTFIVFVIAILINTSFPRFRIEQAFKFYWKYEAVAAVISLVWVYYMVIS